MNPSKIQALKKALSDLKDRIIALFKEPVPSATTADSTSKVGGKSIDELINIPASELSQHIAREDNPHQLKLSDLNAYSREEVEPILKPGIPEGVLPVSFYGSFDMQSIPVSIDNLRLGLPAVNAMMSGRSYAIAATVLDASAYLNITNMRLYLCLILGEIRYLLTTDVYPESNTRMLIGTLTTNGYKITSASVNTVFRLDNYRLSVTPAGSSIPVTDGPYVTGSNVDDSSNKMNVTTNANWYN